jgi:hypothetical protein
MCLIEAPEGTLLTYVDMLATISRKEQYPEK